MINHKISVCLIVRNELLGCKNDVPLIPIDQIDEIFAIDGGSTDGTIEYLKSQKIEVYRQKEEGLNNAYLEANKRSKNNYIVVFFPKKNIDPNVVLNFKDYFLKDYDLVIASRMLKDSINEEDHQILRFRKWSSLLLSRFVSFIWKKEGKTIKDILHGIKGWNKNSFNKMKILDKGLTIDLEMVLQSYKLKLKRVEFPIHEKSLPLRKTNFPFWLTGLKILKFLIFEIFGKNRKQ